MTFYLVLHKVRGKPAFDIAIKLKIGDEDGWIIPTSGWRCYPYWAEPLKIPTHFDISVIPPDTRDHYEVTKSTEPSFDPRAMLTKLGITPKPIEPMRRRL